MPEAVVTPPPTEASTQPPTTATVTNETGQQIVETQQTQPAIPEPAQTAMPTPPEAPVVASDAQEDTAERPETVTRQRQYQETQMVSSTLLHRKKGEVRAELQGKTAEQQRQILDGDPAKKAVATLNFIEDIPDNSTVSLDMKGDGDENKVMVTLPDGTTGRIVAITGRVGEKLTCTVTDGDREIPGELIDRAVIIQAQLQVDSQAILSQFSQEERAVLETYMQTLQSGESSMPDPTSAEGLTLNEALKKSGENAGMITTDTLESYINKTATSEAQRDRLLLRLQGKNIVDAQTMSAVLGGDIAAKQREYAASVRELEAAVQAAQTPEAKAKAQQALNEAKQILEVVQRAQDGTRAGGELTVFFDAQQQGLIDQQQSEAIIDALQRGDIEGLILAAMPKTDNESPEQTANREYYMKLVKRGGFFAGIAALLALMAAGAIFKPQQ